MRISPLTKQRETDMKTRQIVIIGIVIVALIILVCCMDGEYGDEARAFLNALRRVF